MNVISVPYWREQLREVMSSLCRGNGIDVEDVDMRWVAIPFVAMLGLSVSTTGPQDIVLAKYVHNLFRR